MMLFLLQLQRTDKEKLKVMAVDYLTRFMIGTPLEDAFSISLMGASCLDLFLNKTISKKELALLPLSYPHHLLICSPLLILRFLIQSTN